MVLGLHGRKYGQRLQEMNTGITHMFMLRPLLLPMASLKLALAGVAFPFTDSSTKCHKKSTGKVKTAQRSAVGNSGIAPVQKR